MNYSEYKYRKIWAYEAHICSDILPSIVYSCWQLLLVVSDMGFLSLLLYLCSFQYDQYEHGSYGSTQEFSHH